MWVNNVFSNPFGGGSLHLCGGSHVCNVVSMQEDLKTLPPLSHGHAAWLGSRGTRWPIWVFSFEWTGPDVQRPLHVSIHIGLGSSVLGSHHTAIFVVLVP